jgi:5-methylcytosine-specific restriction endonuclease McrA
VEDVGEQECIRGDTARIASETGPMDEVGKLEGDAVAPVRAKKQTHFEVRSLSYADAARLINSTPLGVVISDRQIRRHRVRAENSFCRGRRIDLVAYAAWLIQRFSKEKESRAEGVSTGNILELVERQECRCALTGRKLEPEAASLDHIVPLTQGGKHVMQNVQILHRDVNRAKGVLTNEQFIALCREVAAWAETENSKE